MDSNSAADCNQTALVLQGIQDAGNVDLSVWLGIYIDGVSQTRSTHPSRWFTRACAERHRLPAADGQCSPGDQHVRHRPHRRHHRRRTRIHQPRLTRSDLMLLSLSHQNEYLLLSYGQNGSPTDAKGVAARTKLLQCEPSKKKNLAKTPALSNYLCTDVQQTNQTIQALNLNKVSLAGRPLKKKSRPGSCIDGSTFRSRRPTPAPPSPRNFAKV